VDDTIDEEEMDQRHKSKEIRHLVTTINDLAVLFKELSILVVEQGTILDRIDFNIETAHKDVKQTVVHIENTVKIEKSTRTKSVMSCLIVGIIVCLVLMILKHT
jgi:syntaxin 16